MPDAAGRFVYLPTGLLQMVRTEVSHIRIGDISPEILHRIKLWSIGWQKLGQKPSPLPGHIALGLAAPVDHQPIPQKHKTPALEVGAQGRKICPNLAALDRSRRKAQGQAHLPATWCSDQGRNCREVFPVGGLDQNRGFPPGSPASPNRRPFREARFVEKAYKSTQFFCFFLIRGHSTRIHRRMRASSLSLALRTGRWQLQPSWRKIFQTCPGW